MDDDIERYFTILFILVKSMVESFFLSTLPALYGVQMRWLLDLANYTMIMDISVIKLNTSDKRKNNENINILLFMDNSKITSKSSFNYKITQVLFVRIN